MSDGYLRSIDATLGWLVVAVLVLSVTSCKTCMVLDDIKDELRLTREKHMEKKP